MSKLHILKRLVMTTVATAHN